MFSTSPLSRATPQQSELVWLKHTLLRCSGRKTQAEEQSLPLQQRAGKPGWAMGRVHGDAAPQAAPSPGSHAAASLLLREKKEGEAEDVTTATSPQDPQGQLWDSWLRPSGMNCPRFQGKLKSTPSHLPWPRWWVQELSVSARAAAKAQRRSGHSVIKVSSC